MDNNETLESRLAALRIATTKRKPAKTELHERLFAELAESVLPGVRKLGDQAPDFELNSVADDRPIRLS